MAWAFHPTVPGPLSGEQAWMARSAPVRTALASDVAAPEPDPVKLRRDLVEARTLPPPPAGTAAGRWNDALRLLQIFVTESGRTPGEARADLAVVGLDLTSLGTGS